jgi:hypothetical protein
VFRAVLVRDPVISHRMPVVGQSASLPGRVRTRVRASTISTGIHVPSDRPLSCKVGAVRLAHPVVAATADPSVPQSAMATAWARPVRPAGHGTGRIAGVASAPAPRGWKPREAGPPAPTAHPPPQPAPSTLAWRGRAPRARSPTAWRCGCRKLIRAGESILKVLSQGYGGQPSNVFRKIRRSTERVQLRICSNDRCIDPYAR